MLKRFSNWFDTLKEPKRFFIFMLMVFGWYVPFTAFTFLDDKFAGPEYHSLRLCLIVLGVVQLTFMIIVAIYRATRK